MLLNVLFPDWLQTLLLTILLLFVINKTVRKGINQWHQEQAAFRQKRATEELQAGFVLSLQHLTLVSARARVDSSGRTATKSFMRSPSAVG